MKQQQFLDVLDRDEAERRWRAVVDAGPVGRESVLIEEALGRADLGPAYLAWLRERLATEG